jgi:hypothetical protein
MRSPSQSAVVVIWGVAMTGVHTKNKEGQPAAGRYTGVPTNAGRLHLFFAQHSSDLQAPSSQPDQAGSPSVQPSAPPNACIPYKFSSHKAISRLVPLSRCLCVNLQPAPASLRSLQSRRLHYFLNELEARFLPNSIVFGLSILASVALLVSTNSEGIPKGETKGIDSTLFHVTPVAFLTKKSPLANRARPSRSTSRIRNSPNYSRILAI